MKWLLALYIFSFSFYSVSMLQCLKCKSESAQCIDNEIQQCKPDELCVSAIYRIIFSEMNKNETGIKRECIERNKCDDFDRVGTDKFYSANVGGLHGSVYFSCCESDNCNNFTFPEPDTRPNGLKCLTCNSTSDSLCNSTISCVGNQDQCLTIKDLFFPLGMKHTMGCISKSSCDIFTKNLDKVQCCSENLCNKV
ncbi:urokinase plasminogen activator surface receptor-like [Clarias gariepinus]|uniref:urokinase plasminogen activator surface receptor-like n=1 Tax=Clarias gariepinus TaxID=13013 RepID=UPI00234C71A2|nr:urokinase plasminogen activator surface receptor-like [Clarias gariepinus]